MPPAALEFGGGVMTTAGQIAAALGGARRGFAHMLLADVSSTAEVRHVA
jgi:hypothetical protein